MHLLNIRVLNREFIPGVAEWKKDAVFAEPLATDAMLRLLQSQASVTVVYSVRSNCDCTADTTCLRSSEAFWHAEECEQRRPVLFFEDDADGAWPEGEGLCLE